MNDWTIEVTFSFPATPITLHFDDDLDHVQGVLMQMIIAKNKGDVWFNGHNMVDMKTVAALQIVSIGED